MTQIGVHVWTFEAVKKYEVFPRKVENEEQDSTAKWSSVSLSACILLNKFDTRGESD